MRLSRSRVVFFGLPVLLALVACRSTPTPSGGAPKPTAERSRARELSPGTSGVPRARETPLIDVARSLIGVPYRFGGETPRQGFDCSGFTQYVLASQRESLPRTAREQASKGKWVPLEELSPGDLVFFSDPESQPHHVGIVTSRPGEALTMIHASTSRGVVEDRVLDSAYWLRRLRFGRRLSVEE